MKNTKKDVLILVGSGRNGKSTLTDFFVSDNCKNFITLFDYDRIPERQEGVKFVIHLNKFYKFSKKDLERIIMFDMNYFKF